MKTIKILMSNPEYDYTTSINPSIPMEDIRKYFVNQWFNVGSVNDLMMQCIDIQEVLP